MHEWLYAPDGYYSRYRDIGKEGDFFTAVSVSKFFGGSIARHLYRLLSQGSVAKDAYVVEIGAHRGYLLADMVQFLYTFDKNLLRSLKFAIIEPFEDLRGIQRDYFSQSFGDAVELVHFKSLEEVRVEEAFVVANEIFDAFACELFYKGDMAYVEDFNIEFKPASEWVSDIAGRYGFERGEVAVGYEEFAKNMASAFEKARFVTFDYGDLVPRNDFSVRVYQGHRVFPLFDEKLDLKAAFKRSDITYDVNFSHLIDAFKDAGFEKEAFKTQLAALVDFGITELLDEVQKRAGFEAYKQEADKVKVLLHPSQMGERFKMVEFVK